MRKITRTTAVATMALSLSLGLAACGDDEEKKSDSMSQETNSPTEMPSETETPMAMDAAFGPGCDSMPESGPGSLEMMATQPVAEAAMGNDMLQTLVSAVMAAELGDTLNNAEALTVFAPSDEAFAKIPEKDLKALLADKEMLTKVLMHHVVEGQVGPDKVAGMHETMNGDMIEVKGSGEEWMVGDEEANVLCGNVATKNAKVYVIDTVLMP